MVNSAFCTQRMVAIHYKLTGTWLMMNSELYYLQFSWDKIEMIYLLAKLIRPFAVSLHHHLEYHDTLRRNAVTSESHPEAPHKINGIIKLTKRLARERNKIRRDFSTLPSTFLNGVRVHIKASKAARKLDKSWSSRLQERAFKPTLGYLLSQDVKRKALHKHLHFLKRSFLTTFSPYSLKRAVNISLSPVGWKNVVLLLSSNSNSICLQLPRVALNLQ